MGRKKKGIGVESLSRPSDWIGGRRVHACLSLVSTCLVLVGTGLLLLLIEYGSTVVPAGLTGLESVVALVGFPGNLKKKDSAHGRVGLTQGRQGRKILLLTEMSDAYSAGARRWW